MQNHSKCLVPNVGTPTITISTALTVFRRGFSPIYSITTDVSIHKLNLARNLFSIFYFLFPRAIRIDRNTDLVFIYSIFLLTGFSHVLSSNSFIKAFIASD